MANQLRISPDQLRERANQYRIEADKMEMVIARMDSLLAALQSEWEGVAFEAFAARYQELKPGFMKSEELIREIAAAMDSTARAFEEMDQTIAAQMRDSWNINIPVLHEYRLPNWVYSADKLFAQGAFTTF